MHSIARQKQKTAQYSDLDKRLPTSGVTSRAIFRSKGHRLKSLKRAGNAVPMATYCICHWDHTSAVWWRIQESGNECVRTSVIRPPLTVASSCIVSDRLFPPFPYCIITYRYSAGPTAVSRPRLCRLSVDWAYTSCIFIACVVVK